MDLSSLEALLSSTGWQTLDVRSSGIWLFIGLFIGCFLAATILPLASEALLLGSVLVLPSDQVVWAIMVATLGNTLGGLSTWAIGYYLPSPKPSRIQDYLRLWGAPLALLAWMPIIGDGINLGAGWLKIHWLPILFYNTIGRGARYIFVVWLGTSLIL